MFGIKYIALVLAAVVGLTLSSGASAQNGGKVPPAAIAVLDSQRIYRDAAALKGAREQLDKYRTSFQSEIAKEEEKLRAEQQEIARQRSVVAPEAFEQRTQAFQKKVNDLQKRIQERSQSLETMFNGVRKQITLEVVEILKDLSKERGFNVVLDRAQVLLFVDNKIDVTEEVLKRLDQRLPTVKVTLPAGK